MESIIPILLAIISGILAAICLWEVLPALPYLIGLVVCSFIFILSVVGASNMRERVNKRHSPVDTKSSQTRNVL